VFKLFEKICASQLNTRVYNLTNTDNSRNKDWSSKPPLQAVPDRFISGRCDISPDVLEKHYDERTESEKRELRKEVFDKNQETSTGGYA
jgi:hypothetical protein